MSLLGAKSLFSVMAANAAASTHDPYMAYNFVVEIAGIWIGGFSEVTGLGSQIDLEPYEEGGVNGYVHQFPKRTKAHNLTLKRGITVVDTLWLWYQSASQGRIMPLNGTIMLLNNQRLPVLWWNFKQAYPVKWTGPEFNAMGNDAVAVESIELVHQGIYRL